MISLVELILEQAKEKFDYACVMLYFNFPERKALQARVDKDDLYLGDGQDGRTYGFGSSDGHTTLLYGLHKEVTLEDVKSVLDKYTYSTCYLHNVSIFDKPDYDVLKFDVKGLNLVETNKDLQQFPFTTEYPEFHAHLTLAYLKKGMGAKYVKLFKGEEFKLNPKKGVFSTPDGKKENIKIKVK